MTDSDRNTDSRQKKTSSFEDVLNENGTLIYTNKGISMLPLLRYDRDLMVIQKKDPDKRCKKYDAVLFKRKNGQYVLHRILKVYPEEGYWIVGDNCVSGENVREDQILGVLTAVKRDQHLIRVTDFGYRCYVHLWCDFYPVRFFLLRCGWFLKGKAGKILRRVKK